jgi:3-phosphoshikimate 1-carboxyvinyltransferase
MRISIDRSEVWKAVQAPSSKSYTIRALMCAALVHGRSEIRHPLCSDDTEAALRVLSQIGVQASLQDEVWYIEGDNFQSPAKDLFCGDSAATLRFMSSICAAIPGKSRLTAGSSLAKRPVKTLVEGLKQWGVDISCRGEVAPVKVNGGHIRGGLSQIPGNISSQYVSAMLLITPLAEQNTLLCLTTPLESKPYVLMTLKCLQRFGIQIKYSDELVEFEASPQSYQPTQYLVEGDWSSASYLLGLGAVAGEITVKNLNSQSLQGDKAILDFLKEMGASIEVTKDSIKVKRKQLNALEADLSDCIDLLPTMAVLAALAQGTSVLTGIQRARLKESNRVQAVKEGLEQAGIKVIEEPDKLTITGRNPRKAIIDSKNDHRIAMAFSLLGAASGGISINNAESVSKTYPEYWNTLRSLGVKLNEQ